MFVPKTVEVSLKDLIKSVDIGEYKIPQFQREYVWNIDKVVDLIDSLLKGFPIGSLILWETREELPEIKAVGGKDIENKNDRIYTSYVIDGQQRLTSLYFALNGLITETKPKVDCSQICVSLIAKNTEKLVFRKIPEDGNTNDYILLKELFWNAIPWVQENIEKRTIHLSKVNEYNSILSQYLIPTTKVKEGSLNLEQIIQVFERINLGGKKLNLYSIVSAYNYVPGKFDLDKYFAELNTNKLINYGEISDTTFLQTISACLIHKCNKPAILEGLTQETKKLELRNQYSKIENALLRAIDHLKGNNYGVRIRANLPYEALLVTFTYFYYKLKSNYPTEIQTKLLCDYFWRAILTNSYVTATDSTLNADLEKIDCILNNEQPQYEPFAFTHSNVIANGKSKSSAFSKGIICLMCTKTPKSFACGQEVIIDNTANSSSSKKQDHHFFPKKSKAITQNKEYKNKVNNVVNIVLIDALTNDAINNKNPSQYIPEFKSKIADFDKILKSHFIELDGYGLAEDDFELFLEARSKAIFKELVGKLVLTKNDKIEEL